ncbi:MAG: hypothetical protein QOI38_1826 [Sphingomonadales bacterium]|jgi:uncharacterized protein YndB with AHSA1/START domain|nr:hypothetical protein [Sphingomonadales bacterium]
MTAPTQRIAPAPIRKTLRVRASQEKAFRVFTANMGRWWLKSHSLLQAPQRDVLIEPRAGGRWYEIGEDGSEQDWGRVLAWDPPRRIVLAWQLNADWAYDPDFETIVEVTFTAEGEETIVAFEHRDLERYGERAEELRGGYESGMDGGWAALLEGFRGVAEKA